MITTHVLDTSRGAPASSVRITLVSKRDGARIEIGRGETDADGRQKTLLGDMPLKAGIHRLTFDTGGYFARMGEKTFYPSVTVLFEITDASQHYHVPILLSPFGYSTYRGS